jgi:hypothetical protein
MAVTDRFRQQHAEILEVVGSLESCLDRVGKAERATVARMALNTLSGKLSIHLAMEDSSLYPRLGSHELSELSDLAQSFCGEMAGIKEVFAAYNRKWVERAIHDDFKAFTTQTRPIIETLKTRIARENDQLYALYDRAGG